MKKALSTVFIILFVTYYFSTIGRSHTNESSNISSVDGLRLLKDGNSRFVLGKSKPLEVNPSLMEGLSKKQRPFAIILSCADSRVPPEIIFNQGLGDLFIVRVAGEVLDGSTIASIEYAVKYLGPHLIVVLGHESCSAVESALKAHPDKSAGSAELDKLLASVYLEAKRGHLESITSEDPLLRKPVMYHVDQVASGLVRRSKIIQEHVEKGSIRIFRAIYSLKGGEVEFWENSKTK